MQSETRPETRTIECWLTRDDARMLSQNGFRWLVSRPFHTRTGTTSNIIWKALSIAPRNTVTWETTYAFNWALSLPENENDRIRLNGPWQRCAIGEAYDLDQFGYWVPSSSNAKADNMTIGVNRFINPEHMGIHIVIGQRDSSGREWEPIFIDQMPLGPNMSAWYRPSEKVEWWFENGSPASLRKSVTLQGARTPIEHWDMGHPTEIEYCSTTYNFKKGEWTTSTDPPPQSLTREADSTDGQPDNAAPNGITSNGCASNGYAIRPKHPHHHHHH